MANPGTPFDKPLRAALYHRVSTDDQNSDNAREVLRTHAARLGAEVALDVEEKGSGARNDRPGLQRILGAARKGQIDLVLVWSLDRFGRSTLDLLANIQGLATAGVRFVAVHQGLDVRPDGDAMSQLILTVLAGVAQFERAMIRDRVKLGMAKARRQGKHLGRPKTVEVDQQAVERLRAEGQSWAAIGTELGCSSAAARRAVGAL